MHNGYEIINESSIAKVLRHWIRLEANRSRYADRREEMLKWATLSDRRLIRRIRKFERTRDDDNPALGWTIGTRRNKNYQKVSCWVLARVSLPHLYTCGISSAMKDDLNCVNGNLKRFVDEGYAAKYPEFRLDSIPPEGEARTVIGIARVEYGQDGTIELIDGAHRVAAMLANGITVSDAYIGQIKE